MLRLDVDEHISIRLVDDKYSTELVGLVNLNFDHLREWMPWIDGAYDERQASDFIKTGLAEFENRVGISLVIFKGESIIGTIRLFRIDSVNRSAEIGYWLSQEHQGAGVISKSCNRLLKYGFDELGVNRIAIRCATENAKSRAIPERMGFTFEGVSRAAEWLHDRFVGLAVYSLLECEYRRD